MEIKRLKDNQIRCALTEEEIEEMGFCIDDIIGDHKTAQEFMDEVLKKVKEQEDIDITLLSPMVQAELRQDHSMAITFGGMSEMEKHGLMDKLMEMMGQMTGKNGKTKENTGENHVIEPVEEKKSEATDQEEVFPELPMQLALEMTSIEDAVRVAKFFAGKEHVPQSSFYKLKDQYYLVMELLGFAKEEIKPLVINAVEYRYRRIATEGKLAYIREHGKCILKQNAILDLLQL